MDYYSARKRNKGLVCETTWMDPKGIVLSEKKKRYKYIGFLKRQNYRIGEQVSCGQGLGKVGGRELAEAIESKIRNSGQGVVPYLDLIIT